MGVETDEMVLRAEEALLISEGAGQSESERQSGPQPLNLISLSPHVLLSLALLMVSWLATPLNKHRVAPGPSLRFEF